MGDSRVTTTTGTDPVTEEAVVEVFKASLRGEVLRSGDDDYDDARKVWNGMIDAHPALIARCAGVADVISCVNLARESKLLVAVRDAATTLPVMRCAMAAS